MSTQLRLLTQWENQTPNVEPTEFVLSMLDDDDILPWPLTPPPVGTSVRRDAETGGLHNGTASACGCHHLFTSESTAFTGHLLILLRSPRTTALYCE